MNRPLLWSIVAAVGAVAGAAWLVSSGKLAPVIAVVAPNLSSTARIPTGKPICTSPVNPNVAAPVDCIPQYIANLPPDPGPAGKQTIEGIDSDKDGVRDDVQRFIAEHWGHSERTVAVLTNIAKAKQIAVVKGDSVTREEAQVLVQPMLDAGACYALALDQAVWDMDALEKVGMQVTNTLERRVRAHAFNYKAAHTLYMAKEGSVVDICGFDPTQFSN